MQQHNRIITYLRFCVNLFFAGRLHLNFIDVYIITQREISSSKFNRTSTQHTYNVQNDISRKIDCKELSSRASGIFHSQINFTLKAFSSEVH